MQERLIENIILLYFCQTQQIHNISKSILNLQIKDIIHIHTAKFMGVILDFIITLAIHLGAAYVTFY